MQRRELAGRIIMAFISAALASLFARSLFRFDSPVTSVQFAVLAAFVAPEEMWVRGRDVQDRAQVAMQGY
jgi:hypothetical protein